MAKITTIPGISESSHELLEAAGFLDLESIAKAGVDELVRELQRANKILKISKQTPDRDTVSEWVDAARQECGYEEEQEEKEEPSQMPVNYEGNTEVAAMLAVAPCAIPLPAKVMMENQLAVADIPPAVLLNRYSGDLEVRVNDRQPAVKSPAIITRDPEAAQSRTSASGNVQRTEPEARLDIDTSRVKSFDEFSAAPKRVAPGKSKDDTDRVALLRAPREETNRGRDPKSRWYIRGVLHTHPWRLAIGALVTLSLLLVMPAAVISTALLFISDQYPGSLPWLPKWILVFPFAMPVLAVLYLILGADGKCRICGQRLFWPKNCRKNSKAHSFPGLGHIIPLSLHLLTFRWFRCTYCGTPVRLKK